MRRRAGGDGPDVDRAIFGRSSSDLDVEDSLPLGSPRPCVPVSGRAVQGRFTQARGCEATTVEAVGHTLGVNEWLHPGNRYACGPGMVGVRRIRPLLLHVMLARLQAGHAGRRVC